LKNHTLIELTKKVEEVNGRITILKNELAANTQAIGYSTHAVEKITEGLKGLAKETGDWRKDDKGHHEGEAELDEKKIRKGTEIVKAIDKLTSALKQK